MIEWRVQVKVETATNRLFCIHPSCKRSGEIDDNRMRGEVASIRAAKIDKPNFFI